MLKERTQKPSEHKRFGADSAIKNARNKQDMSDFTMLGKVVLIIVVSMILSGTSISGTPIPAVAALCGALSPMYAAAALAGGTAGFIIRAAASSHLSDIIAMAVMVVFRIVLSRVPLEENRRTRTVTAVFSGLIYIASGMVVAAALDFSAGVLIATLFRGVLCAAACYLFMSVILSFDKTSTVNSTDRKGALAAVFVLAVTALAGVSYAGINAGHIAAFFAIISASTIGVGGGIGGGVMYALSVCALLLYAPELAGGVAVASLAAVVCGVFRFYGKLAVTAAFITISLLTSVAVGIPTGSIYIFAEILIAAFVFVLMPERVYDRLRSLFFSRVSGVSGNNGNERVRLKTFGGSFGKITENLNRAAAILNNQDIYGKNNFIDFTGLFGKICTDCAEKHYCNMRKKPRFMHECENIETELTRNGFVTARSLHIDICEKKEIIADRINKAYNLQQFTMNMRQSSTLTEETAILAVKSAQTLYSTATDSIISMPDTDISALVADKLASVGMTANVVCGTDDLSFYHAEIFIESGSTVNTCEHIYKILTRATGKTFEAPAVLNLRDGQFRIRFSERFCFRLEDGVFETAAPESRSDGYSGDNHAVFEDGFGNVYYILSDGMGSGARAAVESSMAVSILSELIKSGADPVSALKFTNLALQIKSSDETTATVDMLIFSRYTGKTKIIKMGAARSIAAISGSIREYAGHSLPAGILTENEADIFSLRMAAGDKLALFTDGITEAVYPKIREMLLSDGISAELSAKMIGDVSSEEETSITEREDDKTLLIISVLKN
jgi:stage II sporulation protein E